MGESQVKRKQIIERYVAAHRKSESYFERGKAFLPGGIPRNVSYYSPFPIVIERGEGSRVFDVDGNEYIDFCNNFASLILGHAHPEVVAAVQKQLMKGSAHATATPLTFEYAELLCNRFPAVEQIRFCNSGTEAALAAMRLARAFSGKNKILKMEGGFHGLSDYAEISTHPPLDKAGDPARPNSIADVIGIPPAVTEQVVIAPFNQKQATGDIIEEHREDLAAVFVEPMMGTAGLIEPLDGYLEFLRDITSRYKILLVFDEIISARLAYGGAHERFQVTPDLCLLGKIIGGGFPVGAVGGRRDVMSLVAPPNNPVSHSGTFSGNPITLAAGMATMKRLTHQDYDDLESKGQRVKEQAGAIFNRLGIKAYISGLGSAISMHFSAQPIHDYRQAALAKDFQFTPSLLNLALLNRGIMLTVRGSLFISVANTMEEIDRFLEALENSLKEIRPVIAEEAPDLIFQ